MTDTGFNSGVTTAIVIGRTTAKVTVGATVLRAYRMAAGNPGTLVRIAWVWGLALAALQWLSMLWLPSWMTDPQAIMGLDRKALLIVSVAGLLNGLVILPALASIAVNWHRVVLLGERPGAWAAVRLDGPVWAYAAAAAAIAAARFVASLPQVMVSLERGAGGVELTLLRLVAGVVMVGALVALPRISLGLPGIAIGAPDASLAAGFRAGRGQTWRLAGGALLCLLPALAVGLCAFAIWPGQAIMMGVSPLALAVRAIFTLSWPFVGIVFLGYLSLAYEHFFAADVAGVRRG